MHELTLCKTILDMVTKHAIENGIDKIASIYLELGELAAVDKSALLFCFPIAAQKTIAEKAQLEIIDISGVASCEQCQKTVTITKRYSTCPDCSGFLLDIIQGDEFRVKSLEGY